MIVSVHIWKGWGGEGRVKEGFEEGKEGLSKGSDDETKGVVEEGGGGDGGEGERGSGEREREGGKQCWQEGILGFGLTQNIFETEAKLSVEGGRGGGEFKA